MADDVTGGGVFRRFRRQTPDPVEVAARQLVEERIAALDEQSNEMLREPASGWRRVRAFDCFAVDLLSLTSPLSALLGKSQEKMVVVLRTPLDEREPRLPVVVADSFKPQNLFHQRALDLDTHVYVPGKADGGPTRRASLVDCSKTYQVPRGLLERRPGARDNHVATFIGYREEIALACSYANGMDEVFDLSRLVRRDQPSS